MAGDTVTGGEGNDRMWGGGGRDDTSFSMMKCPPRALMVIVDIIFDFRATEQIDLTGFLICLKSMWSVSATDRVLITLTGDDGQSQLIDVRTDADGKIALVSQNAYGDSQFAAVRFDESVVDSVTFNGDVIFNA